MSEPLPVPPPAEGPRHPRQHPPIDHWKTADSDGDGVISRTEFGAMPRLENLPADKQEALFKRLDKDSSGTLSRGELNRLFKPQEPKRPMMPRLAELDIDHNGRISLAEFKAGEIYKKLPPERQDALFRRLDADGDGDITPKDHPPGCRPSGPPPPRDLRQIFRSLDQDSDGTLTLEEFSQAPWLKELNPAVPQERFEKLDANKDQRLDGPEFSRHEPKSSGRGEGNPRPNQASPAQPRQPTE